MARRFLASTVALDLASLLIAIGVASLVAFHTPLPWHFRSDVWALLVSLAAGGIIGSYVTAGSLGGGVPRPSYGRAVSLIGMALAFTAIVLVVSRAYWSRLFMAVTAATWLALTLSHRAVRRRRPWTERLVIVTGEKELVDHLMKAPHAEVLSVVDPGGLTPEDLLPPGAVLAVDLRAVLSDEMARFVSSCNLAGIPIRSLVSVYEEHTGRLPIVHLLEGWELAVPLSSRGLYMRAKRLIDTTLVLLVSPVVLILGLVVAAAIRIDSPGPVIFRQVRIGREGRRFTLYKFRTMRVQGEMDGARFSAPGDYRLTRVGRLIRRVHIDELPQLWNVLKGDLSLVGPRPEQGPFVERFSESIPFYTHRHLVRPGVTGWAQVNFGYADSEADTIEKLSYDLYYVKHVSPWLDLEVLGRSVWTVLSGFGAQ
ncbi:MAG: sugar transferase [Acidimicrobiia bacterium]